jgi:hypothetical protein
LSVVDQDLVTANIIYLHNKEYLRGKFYAGSATPVFLKITPTGIDLVEELLEKFEKYLEKQDSLSKDEITVRNLLSRSKPDEKLKDMRSLFTNFPGLFDEFCKITPFK